MRTGAQRKIKNMGVGRGRSLLVLPALLLLIILAAYLKIPWQQTARFIPLEAPVSNPLMGVAVHARSDPQTAPQDTRLVWAIASWRELEPQEGEYAFDAFDQAIHLSDWRERDVKLIFRLALELTDSGNARDIPDWLYEKVRGGTAYRLNGQECYAPDYASPVLQEAHLKLLQAIEARYGEDIAYVEMGSLGADGAWKSGEGAPALPMVDVTGVYIWQYFTAFPQHPVLAAGPYHEANLLNGGAYLDSFGNVDAAWDWVNRFRFGGWDEQIAALLRADAQFGLRSPAGAWLAADADAGPEEMERMARESRAVYLCVDGAEDVQKGSAAADEIGYRFWIRQAQWPERVRRDYSLYVDISVENDGAAPMPVSWPVCLALLDEQGEVVHAEAADADPHAWLPGETQLRVRLTVPYDLAKGEYTLAIAICEPETLEPAVRFAMECGLSGLWHELGSVEVY